MILFPVAAYANTVWPALFLEKRLFSWWAIAVGLVIEYLFVRKLFGLSPKMSAIATMAANFFSALLGFFLIPVVGLLVEFFPGLLLYNLFNIGSFHPVSWFQTFLMACAVNVTLEGFIYKNAFNLPFRYKGRLFLWFMLANAASVGVALVSLIIFPAPFR